MTVIFVVCVALFVNAVLSHNWLNGPSRAGDGTRRSQKASTRKPSPPSATGRPQVQVRAGQPFQVEWVVGHDGSSTYLIMLSKKDENRLGMHDERLLNRYFDAAPAQYQGPTKGAQQKFHRQLERSTNLGNKRNFFERVVPTNDPLHVARDDIFQGSFRGARNNKPDPDDVYQCAYKTADHRRDRWAVYKNNQYPWIIGAGRWLHVSAVPTRPDFAMIEFPADTPPGEYIVHYRWRGFYDAIDLNIVGGTQNNATPYGRRFVPMPGVVVPPDEYKKIDHCWFPEFRERHGRCFPMKAPMGVPQACIDECNKKEFGECNGVVVVPIDNPSSVWSGFKDKTIVPFNNDDCRKPTDGATHVCFAAQTRMGSPLIFEYYATSDSEDPAFYSTCFMRIPRVMGFAAPAAKEVEPIDWEYRGRCISCADREKFSAANVTPDWRLTETCAPCTKFDAPAPVGGNSIGSLTCANSVWLARMNDAAGARTGASCGIINKNSFALSSNGLQFVQRGGKRGLAATGDGIVRVDPFYSGQMGRSFTFFAWFRVETYDAGDYLVSIASPSTPASLATTRFAIRQMASSANAIKMQLVMKIGTGAVTREFPGTVAPQTWTAIAVTYDGSNLNMYLGDRSSNRQENGNFDGHPTYPFVLFGQPSGNGDRGAFTLREVALVRNALNAASINKLIADTA